MLGRKVDGSLATTRTVSGLRNRKEEKRKSSMTWAQVAWRSRNAEPHKYSTERGGKVGWERQSSRKEEMNAALAF